MKSAIPSRREAASNVAFALCLTAIMAVPLFAMVGLNPKTEGYGNLPWYYAGACVLISIANYTLYRRLQTAPNTD